MTKRRLQYIDPVLVSKMASLLPRESPEEVQCQFGIGINTWVKLRRGEAIRYSVAERLVKRVEDQLVH